jgi:hypothetical protein
MDEHSFEFLRSEQHDRWLGFRREDVRQWLLDAGLQQVMVDCVGESCGAASVSLFVAAGEKAGP